MVLKKTSYILVIITVCFVVFFPTFFNDFQRGWDDTWQLLENPYVIDHTFDNILYHFKYFYYGQYSPVNTLVYIFVYSLFGFNPTAFHGICWSFHIINALFVYFIVKDIIKTVKPHYKERHFRLYAFFVALLFAIHPLQVESVAWISASKVVLYSFFTLIAIWCYIRYVKSIQWYWFIGVMAAYALGFGSKEQAIILPLTLVVFDYVYGRYKGISLDRGFVLRRAILEKIPLFLMAMLFWYFSVSNNLGVISLDKTYPLYQRLLMGASNISEYIFRFIAPVKLYYYYFFPIKVGERLPLFYWGYIVLLVIIGGFIWGHYKKKNKIVIFGFLFFIVNILLVLHIIPTPRKMITADRYIYLSTIGLALILAWYVDYFYSNYHKYKKYVPVLIAIYTLFLGVHTFIRTQDWKNSDRVKNNIKELIERRKKSNKAIINTPLTDE